VHRSGGGGTSRRNRDGRTACDVRGLWYFDLSLLLTAMWTGGESVVRSPLYHALSYTSLIKAIVTEA